MGALDINLDCFFPQKLMLIYWDGIFFAAKNNSQQAGNLGGFLGLFEGKYVDLHAKNFDPQLF